MVGTSNKALPLRPVAIFTDGLAVEVKSCLLENWDETAVLPWLHLGYMFWHGWRKGLLSEPGFTGFWDLHNRHGGSIQLERWQNIFNATGGTTTGLSK